MSKMQADLFGTSPSAAERPSEAVVAIVRAQLHATLALMKAASAMPWTDRLAMVHAENGFRFGTNALPPDEGATLWAEFDVEMDRLYAIMNQGLDSEA